jgi:photosystem II stability/assembly factor-like uncharacterized protein
MLCLAFVIGLTPRSSDFTFPVSVANVSLSGDHWAELGPKPIASWQDCCVDGISHPDWGNAPFSGRINAIAINASDTSIIYIGAAGGGVWKSTDSGATWAPLTDDQPSIAVGAITISPDGKTLFVGTGDPNNSAVSYVGSGLLRSSDGGRTWTVLGNDAFPDSAISSVLTFPGDPNRLLVATTYADCCEFPLPITPPSSIGVFLSTNGGGSWTHSLGIVNATEQVVSSWDGFADLVAHPTNSSIVYAGDFAGNTWESTDKGHTWNKILVPVSTTCTSREFPTASGPAESLGCRVALAVTPQSPDIILSALSNSTGGLAGFAEYNTRTHGNPVGLNFPPAPNQGIPICGSGDRQCNYDLVLAIDPGNSNVIYVGTVDLYKSIDGGISWTDLGGYSGRIHPDQHVLIFLPGSSNTIFVGNDGGLWKSTDSGNSWNDLNNGLGITQFYHIAINGGKLLGGAQDNGFPGYTGSGSWIDYPPSGDGGWTGFEPGSPNIMYAEGIHLSFSKSVDGGATWTRYNLQNLDHNWPYIFFAPMAQDVNLPGTLYIGSANGVWKSSDYGASWTLKNIGSSQVTSIATSPSKGGVVYVGFFDGSVRVSMDGLATSTQVLSSGQNPFLKITTICVDPNNPSLAYVSRYGSRTNMFTEFYNITNAGGTWQSARLQDPLSQNINVISIGPDSKTIIVGTDHGVYYSTDHTASWSTLGQGLPNGVVFDLELVSTNTMTTVTSTLYAATFGRGIWSFVLGTSDLLAPDFSISASPSTQSVVVGAVAHSTITITATQGMTGTITLTTDNSACNLTPSTLLGSGSSTLSCTFTTAQTITVTVTASGGGQSHSKMVTYTVGGETVGGGVNGAQLAIGAAALVIGINWIGGAIIGALIALKRKAQTSVATASPAPT